MILRLVEKFILILVFPERVLITSLFYLKQHHFDFEDGLSSCRRGLVIEEDDDEDVEKKVDVRGVGAEGCI